MSCSDSVTNIEGQKQQSRGVLKKRCFENMHQFYSKRPVLKCNFKVRNDTPAWVFSCKFAAYVQGTIS